jgi:ankyrin repeat protein
MSFIHKACNTGDLDSLKLSIKQGADISEVNHNGFDALAAAVHHGHAHIVNYLLSIGSDPNREVPYRYSEYGGDTPLILALSENANYEIVQQLISAGVNINHKSTQGLTALHTAVTYIHTSIVKLLLLNGADPNLKNKNGSTALHIAVITHHPEIVELLIQHGARLNEQNIYGRTPLISTICFQKGCQAYITATQLLLAGADPNIQDNQGKRAIQFTDCAHIKKLLGNW